MSDAPSWLNETANSSAKSVGKAAVSNPAFQKAAVSAATSAYVPPTPPNAAKDVESGAASPVPSEFNVDEATLKSMGQYLLALRLLYMTTAIFLGTAAGLSLVGQTDLGLIFFAFYVLFFALLICCFEVALSGAAKYIANNFGFMYTLVGRWTFLLFVGFMSFSLGTIGIAAMCWLYVVGLIHVYVMFKFPKFEQYVRRKHYYEGKQ